MSPDPLPVRTQIANFLVHLPDVDDEARRRALLRATGLARLQPYIDFDGPAFEFVEGHGGLLDAFAGEGPQVLAAFLAALPGCLSTSPGVEDQQRLQDLAAAVHGLAPAGWQEQFPAGDGARSRLERTVSPNPIGARAALAAARAARAGTAQAPAREPCCIGDDAVWGYDLIPQMAAFMMPFGQAANFGIFRFATCGNQQFIETYLIARLRDFLQNDRMRTLAPGDPPRVVLTYADATGQARALDAVDAQLKVRYNRSLASLTGKKGVDCLLLIENTLVQPAQAGQVQAFMTDLAQDLAARLSGKIQQNKLYLIILWIDLFEWGQPGYQPPYPSLPPVDHFPDTQPVLDWLDRQLAARVENARRRRALTRLKQQLGGSPIPWDVYEALRKTVEELRRGEI